MTALIKNIWIRTVLLSSFLFMVTACLKNPPEFPETLEWNPAIAFPLGEESYGLNAVSGFDTTLLELDPITQMPRWTGEIEVALEGIMDFSLVSIQDNLNNLNSMLFRVNLYNGFPKTILAQAYFLDASSLPVDSMFREGPMEASPGSPVGSGETVQPSHSWQDARFDRARIQNLDQAVSILFRAVFIVEPSDTILAPYYPSYELDVRIGAMLDLTMEL